ncbi:MAG: methionine--tRNA ligase [Candidatus Yanofskybacteria bacterium]|nr:methionine--tRNA ligase [Candidatus Yanofskybacteria bacterium]
MNKFYITTSIPYVNAPGHIGHALEFIQADVVARYRRRQGKDVFFLTGTDEHGTKIAKAAQDAGVSPKEFTDKISGKFFELTKALGVSNDDFIRTTDSERHWPAVKAVWEKLQANGDLSKAIYEGLYCSGCEAFITEKELVDGECSIHKKEPERVQEENWFFQLSKYQDRLREKIEADELRIVPESRKNEILSLINQGLQDVSFSRPKEKLQWGIPVPGDDSSVIYVWADALVNYISALGYPDGESFKKYWPADVHIVGKDILRFHATIWPAILLSLGIDLPRTIFVHGFITVDGQKMSKSLGNVIDPFSLIEKYGADAVRYFFLRELPPTEDGDFSYEKFEARYNGDLAAGLGNLVARVLTMARNHNPEFALPEGIADDALRQAEQETQDAREAALESFMFSDALEAIWTFIHFCDRYIEEKRPWEDSEHQEKALASLLGAVMAVTELIRPFLPETSEQIARQLQERKKNILFPRLDRA